MQLLTEFILLALLFASFPVNGIITGNRVSLIILKSLNIPSINMQPFHFTNFFKVRHKTNTFIRDYRKQL